MTALHALCETGWLHAVHLAEYYRDDLTLPQLIRVEIASHRGPEQLSAADAGEMVALFASVVEA